MQLNRFDYELPRAQIAQFPTAKRGESRLLYAVDSTDAVDSAQQFAEMRFGQLGELLRDGDLLIANDTRVLAARIAARKPSGAAVEIMLERIIDSNSAQVRLRANKPMREGQPLIVGEHSLCVRARRDGFFIIESDDDIAATFAEHGEVPLPPYIARRPNRDDDERYQTVYASQDGAVAAPTAGLHFDRALIDALQRRGIGWATVTLHIGAGTYQPVRASSIDAHQMHREWFAVGRATCACIAQAKARGARVIAVGTTVVRALESAVRDGVVQPMCGDTELFIRRGYRFCAVDALITNFHLPRSTLLMMVCAFAGHARVMRAYRYALANGFRFYSYGDAMFIERKQKS